jgi:hypothetical protein
MGSSEHRKQGISLDACKIGLSKDERCLDIDRRFTALDQLLLTIVFVLLSTTSSSTDVTIIDVERNSKGKPRIRDDLLQLAPSLLAYEKICWLIN